MSDFLSQLAIRSRTTTPAVTPRLPTRFEPDAARANAGESLSHELFVERESAPPAASAINLRPRSLVQGSVDPSPSAPVPPQPRTENRFSFPRHDDSSRTVSERAVSSERRTSTTDSAERRTDAPDSSHKFPSVARSSDERAPSPVQPSATTAAAHSPTVVATERNESQTTNDRSITYDDRSRSSDESRSTEARDIEAERRATATVAPPLEPRVAAVAPDRLAARPERPADVQMPPVIEVTIGRIEVRAVTTVVSSTPPPAAPIPKLPIQTLDEYLRERSGGRR